jgi:hypothetical protein
MRTYDKLPTRSVHIYRGCLSYSPLGDHHWNTPHRVFAGNVFGLATHQQVADLGDQPGAHSALGSPCIDPTSFALDEGLRKLEDRLPFFDCQLFNHLSNLLYSRCHLLPHLTFLHRRWLCRSSCTCRRGCGAA